MNHPSDVLKNTRLKLTGLYLLIIMAISLLFSAVIYQLTYQELDRHISGQRRAIDIQLERRQAFIPRKDIDLAESQLRKEARNRILFRLLFLNVIVVVSGGILSYILADKTLRPIEKAHVSQKRFTSSAAHELRTPLAALKIENEVLLRSKKATREELFEQIKSNIQEVDRLVALTTAMMDISKLEEVPLSFEQVRLQDVVKATAEKARKVAALKKITISTNLKKATILGNESSIERILTILLDNAVKYSPENSTITVELINIENLISLSVSDQGPGIQEKDMPHIFERFYRSDTSRSTEGHGLGLALAHDLAVANKATLSVKNNPQKGARFSLVFTLQK